MTQLQEHVGANLLLPGWEAAEVQGERIEMPEVAQPIDGDPTGKNLLSMLQFGPDDIYMYIDEARAAAEIINDRRRRGVLVLPFTHMDVVMRQNSTRTGGSMVAAMEKLGGSSALFSGMATSSEAKGESRSDSELALATQSDIVAMRTAEGYGPVFAAQAIAKSRQAGKMSRAVPVINLGDGKIEHPTQALGDLSIMQKYRGDLDGQTLAVVGDHERYRAHHSLILGAATVGMNVIAVETPGAPVPQSIVDIVGSRLQRTTDLDAAMREADVLYMGRNPDEYTADDDASELARSAELKAAFEGWVVDRERLQQMHKDAILLHPRPRRNELHPSVDTDPRAKDVEQMELMVAMRMAILARHMGASIMFEEVA